MTGQIMIYIGISLIVVGIIFLITSSIIFAKMKENVINKIYE